MEAKLSSRRIMSAACLETSDPAMPMATPMSAFFRAGESFTPSPVTATIAPCGSGSRKVQEKRWERHFVWLCLQRNFLALLKLHKKTRENNYLALAAFNYDQLLLRRCSGKHNLCVVLQDIVQLFRRQVLEVTSMDYTGFGIPGEKPRRIISLTDPSKHPPSPEYHSTGTDFCSLGPEDKQWCNHWWNYLKKWA